MTCWVEDAQPNPTRYLLPGVPLRSIHMLALRGALLMLVLGVLVPGCKAVGKKSRDDDLGPPPPAFAVRLEVRHGGRGALADGGVGSRLMPERFGLYTHVHNEGEATHSLGFDGLPLSRP